MATKTADIIDITSTATLVIAANASRRSTVIQVVTPNDDGVYLGPDNTVTVNTGLNWRKADGPLVDNVPSLDAWYAITRAGTTAKVSYLEITG